jgi:anti-sigma factor RsiW
VKIENEKVVAGLSCGRVLEQLSDYLDGDLGAEPRGRLEEHLRGCDGCARFGGAFRSTVQALRGHLAQASGLSEDFRRRLRRALEDAPPR